MNIDDRYRWGWSSKELAFPHVHELDEHKKFPVTHIVEITHKLDVFKVVVGNNMTVTFTIDTLPYEIKSALAMIHAVGLTESRYAHQSGGALQNVGYFYGDEGYLRSKIYKVVITAGLLKRMRENERTLRIWVERRIDVGW